MGVGELRIFQTQHHTEQVLCKQLPLRSKQAMNNGMDTVWADYLGIRLQLAFSYYTLLDDDDLSSPKLLSLWAEPFAGKTGSGIAPGDDKFDFMRKRHGCRATAGPD
jgi:hypothetical protein